MDKPGNIILIGPMGAGKTTVGRRLAHLLNMRFHDSDIHIIERTGVDIPTIFDIEGEAGFRVRETHALEELTHLEGIVLATGGGAILREENREILKSRGWVIYLTVPLHLQLKRTQRDPNRPLLQTGNPRVRLQKINQERDPLYREVADWVVDTRHNDSCHLARKLSVQLRHEGILSFRTSTHPHSRSKSRCPDTKAGPS